MYLYQDALTIEHTENSISQTYNCIADEVVGDPVEDMLVRQFCLAQIPNVYMGLPIRRYHQTQASIGTWKITVRWELINWSLQFELTGNHQHITQAKEHINQYASEDTYDDTDPDFQGGINVDRSGTHGCEIYVPSGQWSETYEIPVGDVTEDYENTVKTLRKSPVNDAPFRGRERGEVLFMGLTGALSSVDPRFYTLTWRFAEEANITGLPIAGIRDTIDKEGWQYLWFFYKERIDTSNLFTLNLPMCANVERVYDYGDFSTLNIGTTRANAGWQGS